MFRDTTLHFAMAIDTLSGIGFAVGDAFPGVSRRSTDGGDTWIKGPPIMDTPAPTLYDVSILGSRLVAVGYTGVAYYSTDGGVTWDRAGTGNGRTLYGVAFRSVGVGVAVGDGVILHTLDGGVFWGTSSQVTTSDFFLDVDYGGNSAFAVGMGGLIMRSTVGQDDWIRLTSGTTADLHGVAFVDSNNGIAVGTGGTILVTAGLVV
jgi:photosystem II stability/assembly factor-like uncharacterized protein